MLSYIYYNNNTEKCRAILEEMWDGLTTVGRLGVSLYAKFNFFNIPEEYVLEIEDFCDNTGFDYKKVYYGNCAYEFSMIYPVNDAMWCSSTVFEEKGHFVHYRNLDWPVKGLKGADLIINHSGKIGSMKYSFNSVTFPGLFGVLTGLSLSGNFTIAVNVDAECAESSISFKPYKKRWPIIFIIRSLLENCKSIEEGKRFLIKNCKPISSAYIHMVSGKISYLLKCEPNGCTILSKVLHGDNKINAITNYTPRTSYTLCERYKSIKRSKNMERTFTSSPVYNEDTCYSVKMDPVEKRIINYE